LAVCELPPPIAPSRTSLPEKPPTMFGAATESSTRKTPATLSRMVGFATPIPMLPFAATS
jgi:hypothetical protein